MPNMDGLQALREIRATYPHLQVIMYSSLTKLGAQTTVEALLLGAQDYEEKPEGMASREEAMERIRQSLIPKMKALLVRPGKEPFSPYPESLPERKIRPDAVLIGASTGGPAALLGGLPPEWNLPILIVQHLPPLFTETLALRLAQSTGLDVREARDGEKLEGSIVRLAPGNFHMAVEKTLEGPRISLSQGPPVNSCRPSVDVLFESAARVLGPNALGVILTGMGQDGLKGAERLREGGATILAQDQASSVVWGMPGMVAQAGLAEAVLDLGLIAGEITLRSLGPEAQRRRVGAP
jgi:two-component system chemotaxis response regulator CheB